MLPTNSGILALHSRLDVELARICREEARLNGPLALVGTGAAEHAPLVDALRRLQVRSISVLGDTKFVAFNYDKVLSAAAQWSTIAIEDWQQTFEGYLAWGTDPEVSARDLELARESSPEGKRARARIFRSFLRRVFRSYRQALRARVRSLVAALIRLRRRSADTHVANNVLQQHRVWFVNRGAHPPRAFVSIPTSQAIFG